MKKWKKLFVMLLCVSTIGVLTACQDQAGKNADETDTNTTQEAGEDDGDGVAGGVVDDVGDAVDQGVDDVTDGVEDLTDDATGAGSSDKTNTTDTTDRSGTGNDESKSNNAN